MVKKLADILDKPYKKIIYRQYDPYLKRDLFVGMCEYDGKTLIPYDGDIYNFYDEINRYEVTDDKLIVWLAN